MLQTVIKLLLSSGIIVIVSEIAKKNTFIGGLIASIPLVSVMAMVWLYIDTKDIENINALSKSILWMVVPSLALFISLPVLLKSGVNFYISMGISILVTMGCYWLTIAALTKFGIKL
ncbi:MAG: hypothetical protein CMG68_04215 [Candidatus Marinimicrobia bacterium]|nr:hypothetical protein [Candidatus Neomarinimicrobiota bacterium]|tara:strand:+ start:8104 stop:8454 length:351 start_codon:yes stop_codon:yes gene_type:complete